MNKKIIFQYKDIEPMETISKSIEKLANLGIITQEVWNRIETEIFSVHLSVLGTTITSNGKGCTRELALASGYGELIERLSFLLPFRVSPFYHLFYSSIMEKAKKNKNNLFEAGNFNEWLESKDSENFFSLIKNQIKYYQVKQEKEMMYRDFRVLWESRQDVCVNYSVLANYSLLDIIEEEKKVIISKNTLKLPYSILDYYYGSNGMCAGNSDEEALIQGICEIIERYVQKRILLGCDDHLYDITQSCIDNYTNISRVKEILKDNGYYIRILECPTVFDIPVVIAILQKKDGAYYVSLGCHPDIAVGIERAIDELFQGYCLESIEGAFKDDYIIDLNSFEQQRNYLNLLKYGVGIYPPRLTLEKFSKKKLKIYKIQSNKEMLYNILEKIKKVGLEIFICRGLELGLCTYHVIIPGISEAENILPSSKIRNVETENMYDNLFKLSKQEALKMANHCELLYNSGVRSLESLLDIDKYNIYCDCTTSLEGISAALFIAILNIVSE